MRRLGNYETWIMHGQDVTQNDGQSGMKRKTMPGAAVFSKYEGTVHGIHMYSEYKGEWNMVWLENLDL